MASYGQATSFTTLDYTKSLREGGREVRGGVGEGGCGRGGAVGKDCGLMECRLVV